MRGNRISTISFDYLKSLFDDTYDIGFLSADRLRYCANMPVKQTIDLTEKPNVANFTNRTHFRNFTNAIVLAKEGSVWDYSHYDEIVEVLSTNGLKNWFEIYVNYKEAAIQSGIGVRARNSLVYSYKFGFDCKLACIGFIDEIIDIPTNLRINNKLWNRCNGCNDCYNACPVKAIHNKQEQVWIDGMACDDFLGYSDHPSIPSIKKFWHKNVHPELSDEYVSNIKTFHDAQDILGSNLPWDANGYTFDGNVTRKNGKKVNIPVCRECTSQPRCSKWGGKFPYTDVEEQKKLEKRKWKRGWTMTTNKDEFKNIFGVPILHTNVDTKNQIENLFAGVDLNELVQDVQNLNNWNCNLKTGHGLKVDQNKLFWVNDFIQHLQPYVFKWIDKFAVKKQEFDIEFGNPWINVYNEGDNQNTHNHLGNNNILSYAYFLTFPENSANIYFNNSMKDKNFHGQDSGLMLNIIDGVYEPKIQQGDLLLFPAWLEHGVNKNKSNQRVTISGNIKIKAIDNA